MGEKNGARGGGIGAPNLQFATLMRTELVLHGNPTLVGRVSHGGGSPDNKNQLCNRGPQAGRVVFPG